MTARSSLPIAFLVAAAVFLALDAAWLMLVAIGRFQSQVGALLKPEPDFAAAAAFYGVYMLGLVVLAIRPALQAGSAATALFNGAVLGLTAYATFDLTNLAILKGWTWGLALMDMAWGTVASALAALAGYAAGVRVR